MLDLGHIAFRRDDTVQREGGQSARSSPGAPAPSDALSAASPFSSNATSGRGEFGTGAVVDEPLGLADVVQNNWQLDISGVQVRQDRLCGGTGLAVK